MKQLFLCTLVALVLGVVAVVGVYSYTAIGRSVGEEWGSLDGPEPVWPSVIGFGGMHLIVISTLALLILALVGLLRAYLPRRLGNKRD